MAEETPGDLTIDFGEGIGRFARDTPRNSRGSPAVSETALSSVFGASLEAMEEAGCHGASVVLRVPGGAGIAPRTLNPRLGIEGGISILGTTGLVEPWDEHLVTSVLERVRESDCPVLTTGRTGLRYSRLLFPDRDVILVGERSGKPSMRREVRRSSAASRASSFVRSIPGSWRGQAAQP